MGRSTLSMLLGKIAKQAKKCSVKRKNETGGILIACGEELYQEQIKIIKSHITKFECIQNHIIRFVRNHRIQGVVDDKKCSVGVHELRFGETTYVYDGKIDNLKSVFCSDLECFLDNLDKTVIKKYIGRDELNKKYISASKNKKGVKIN